MNTDEAMFVIDVCRITAEAWAAGDLNVATKVLEAAFVTIEQCGVFIDVLEDAPR